MKWLSKIVEGEKLVKQTKENINKHIVRGILSLIMLAVILVLILMPFIIDMTYNCPPPIDFFDVELSKSDILDYYAQLLSLLATIVLGVIAVIQTYRSQVIPIQFLFAFPFSISLMLIFRTNSILRLIV